jgi:hypothetical protein
MLEYLSHLRLVRDLAAGADPEGSARLRACAARLTSRRTRERLARSINGAIETADKPAPRLTAAVPPARDEVLAASHELRALAHRLCAPAPAAPRGVALVELLLRDGASALYLGGGLRAEVRKARLALDASRPWSPDRAQPSPRRARLRSRPGTA